MSGRDPLARLPALRARARAALLWEALWPRLWPALGVVGAFLVLALSGAFLAMPAALHGLVLLALLGLLGVALHRGLRGLDWPDDAAAERRLERVSGLSHRPLSTLRDRPALGGEGSGALWAAHQRRERARLSRLRAGLPRPGLVSRDPRALRAGLSVALVAALVVAGGEAPERLRRALWPAGAGLAAASLPAARLEAWITPPAYTGAAPVFLDAAGGEATVPAGSRLRVALSGGVGAPELAGEGVARPFEGHGAGGWLAEAALEVDARVAVRQGGREVAAWSLAVRADQPPRAHFPEAPGPAARGLATRLPWAAEDDWGVVSARAEFRLEARPDAAPLALDLAVPHGEPRAARGVAQPDLSAHPWAGLPVRARLLARDGAGQEGASAAASLTLPERGFENPVARAIIALRRGLSVSPEERAPAILGLDRLGEAPEAFDGDAATTLALRSSRTRLAEDARPEAVGEVQQTLWETALALEEGRTDRTARALAEAREALREALRERGESLAREREAREAGRREEEARREGEEAARREAGRDPGREAGPDRDRAEAARPESERAGSERAEAERRAEAGERREAERRLGEERRDADRRIQALREAIRRHLEALAERRDREESETGPQDPAARQQERREVDRRTGRMREANRQDRPQDAERELAELEQMLEELESGGALAGRQEQRRQQRDRGQQQMGVVQDLVRRQTGLLDGAHRRAEAEEGRQAAERRLLRPWPRSPAFQPPGFAPFPPQPAPQAGPRPAPPEEARERQADARTQRALRRALGELMQQHGDLTGEVPAPLGRADQAMREGSEALIAGADPRPHQERAVRELSEGGRQMAQGMQRQFGQEGQEGEGEGQGDAMAEAGEMGGEGQDELAMQGEGRDPLGRRLREPGGLAQDGGDTRVPDEAEELRTRRLQAELRRRSAERERPAEELDYLERLLRRF